MSDLLDITRLLVIAGYAVVGMTALYLLFRAKLTSHIVGLSAVGVIAVLWVVFYSWLMLIAPLDADEVRAASLLSRVIHVPVIASIGVMLYTLSVQIKTLRAISNGNK